MDNSDTLNVRIFRIGRSSCGGGIGSRVCGYVRIKRERKREKREREKNQFFVKERDLRKREACDWKEGKKETRYARDERSGGHGWMDPGGWTYG